MADMTTYEIVTSREGTFRLTVPSTFKVTYGMLHPGTKGGYGDGGNVLRIYEAETKQRAIFQGVTSFRDLSLKLERKVSATDEKSKQSNDGKGNIKAARAVVTQESWEEVA